MKGVCHSFLFLSVIAGTPSAAFSRTCPDFASLARSVQPAVVSVLVELENAKDAGAGIVPLYPEDTTPFVQGMGSGFVVGHDGLIVTCHHVIAGARRIKVRMWGSSTAISAKVVGTAPEADLALLKIDAPRKLNPLRLGDSDAIEVGQWVVAVGNPLGMTAVVTKGIISGLGRSLEDLPMPGKGYADFIQTDASIDLGSSGGPLVNLRGEVVGINTAMNASGRGISFAVPVNLLKALMPQLLKDGRHTRAYMGIRIERYIPKKNIASPSFATAGVLITRVLPDSPAHRAGLAAGDLLVRLGPFAVNSVADAVWKVSTLPVGTKSPVEVLRGGKRHKLWVVPVPRSSRARGAVRRAIAAGPSKLEGLEVAVVDAEGGGVIVAEVAGEAQQGGLRIGDVLLRVDGRDVHDVERLNDYLSTVKTGTAVRFYVKRGTERLFVALVRR